MPRRVKHSNIARWMVEMMWSLACGKSAEAFNTTGTVFCEQLEGKEFLSFLILNSGFINNISADKEALCFKRWQWMGLFIS